MDIRDVATIMAFVAFMWLCDWAPGTSKWHSRAIIFAGFALYILGSSNGAQYAREKIAKDAQQAAILTSPGMPR